MEQLRHSLTNISPKGQTCRADQNPLKRSDLDDFESPAARSPSLRVACYNPKHDRGIFSSGWRSRLMMATCFSFSCALDVFPSCCCFATAVVFAATLEFAALIFGSMAPDFGYHIHQVGFATFAHTLPGTVLAAVPIGLMFLIIFYLVRRPVCYIFPQPHRAALLPLCAPFPQGLKRWLIILLSLLIGVWTHTFWDAWTHDDGWFVERVPALQQPLFRVGATVVDTAFCLQVLSSFLGLLILAIAYFLWLRRRPAPSTVDPESDRWRYFFWAGIGP